MSLRNGFLDFDQRQGDYGAVWKRQAGTVKSFEEEEKKGMIDDGEGNELPFNEFGLQHMRWEQVEEGMEVTFHVALTTIEGKKFAVWIRKVKSEESTPPDGDQEAAENE